MAAEAFKELGPEGVRRRLGLAEPAPMDARELVNRLLTCVYLKTRNSGEVTRAAASGVAKELGAAYHEADVQPMVDAYTFATEQILDRRLVWDRDDLTLQNIQARARAPLVWMLANARGAILITTSNRSEAAVGYATMDGDTAGGLAPLAGIDKQFLRQWLAWAQTSCRAGLGPLSSLGLVTVQPPTAELRPPGATQTDEADLMPYAVLERIERYLVRDRLGPDDIMQTLLYDFPEISAPALAAHLDKFFRLWAQNQWKRERLAPAFHLDDESLDPKTWCRFPILSRPYRLTEALPERK
jgi:NAD+ synthase (glutamine-hydrolysing)